MEPKSWFPWIQNDFDLFLNIYFVTGLVFCGFRESDRVENRQENIIASQKYADPLIHWGEITWRSKYF